MSLILLACTANPVDPVEVAPVTWESPVPVEALQALGAVVSGSELDAALDRLGQAEVASWASLSVCDERPQVLGAVASSLLEWPDVAGPVVHGVEPVAVRLMGAAALDAQVRSGEVALAIEDIHAACAVGEGTEGAAVTATHAVLDMQASALRAFSESARFLTSDELTRVVEGREVRGWLGLGVEPAG